MRHTEKMPEEKNPRKKRVRSPLQKASEANEERLAELIKSLMDWHLGKINGDPETESFDILLQTKGTHGGVGCKYMLGDHDASKAQLKAQLESQLDETDMYAYSFNGHWQNPAGDNFDGVIVILETMAVPPNVIAYEIAPDADDRLAIKGEMHHLGLADWSLFHRSPQF